MSAQKRLQGKKNRRERKLKVKNTLQKKNCFAHCMKRNIKPG